MTDKQIISFLESRAKKVGQSIGCANITPHLGIIKSGNNLFLCVLYKSTGKEICTMLRFKQNGQYGIFKLVSDSSDFIKWKTHLLSELKYGKTINYEEANVPDSIKHLVISTVIKALNTPGMALYATMYSSSEPLISENENYESICIDYDLSFDEFVNL